MTKKLQVFVSSTYMDLKQERQAAVAAILKAGHIPAGMELFTSGDKSQLETIKSWIDESDVYMLILGGRYGSIESESGIGYTEIEFDYAASQNKPMFSVVITEKALQKKVQEGGVPFIETHNGAALENFRKKVLSYISSFFDDDKDIRLTVYESLADFSANKDLVGWVRGNTAVDTTPLFEEIAKLSAENGVLRNQVSELERRAKKVDPLNEEIKGLINVLKATAIEVPSEATKDGKAFKTSIYDVFLQAQSSLATGVYNKESMSEMEAFLFFNVAPELQIHELVQYEKVPGVRYRRCTLTSKGASFLSYIAKIKAQNSSPVETSLINDDSTSSTVEGEKRTSPATKRTRSKTKTTDV